jgi:ankyrin repeat protein
MKYYFKYFIQLVVFTWFSVSYAGSYEDFFKAIQVDDSTAVTSLLVRGFDPNTLSPNGVHPLVLSLQSGSLKVAMVMLDHPGIQVETRTLQDESPLMLASLKGYLNICKKLIERDADVNKPGWAPLHYAATGGHISVIQMLLDNHAYIDAASPNGSTPLMMAAKYGSPAAVKQLLEAGADPLLKNNLDLTAIDFAISNQRSESASIIATFVRGQKPKGTW